MQLKFVTGIAFILVLLLACSGNANGFQSRESTAIKVVVDQAKDGDVPVEIIQPMVASSAPNKLDANQSTGATRYRLSLLKTLKTKGAADVENYLKQNQ